MKFVGIHSYIFANIKQYRYICNDLTSVSQKKGVYMKSLNHYELYDDYKTEENVSRNEQKMDNNHYNSTNTIDKGLLGGEIWYT